MVTQTFWLKWSRWKKPVAVRFATECEAVDMIRHYRLKKYEKELLADGTADADGATIRVFPTPQKIGYYVWLRKKDLVILTHECSHLALRLILDHRQKKIITANDSEVLAQLTHKAFELLYPLIAN